MATQKKFVDDEGAEWDDAKIPKPVKDAVEDYERARKAASRAAKKKAETRDNARSLMDKHDVDKVPYTDEYGNRGWIYRFDKPELKSRRLVVPKRKSAAADVE